MTSWKRHERAPFNLRHLRNADSVIRWDQSAGDKTHTHNPQEKYAFGHTRGNTTQPCGTERATGELLGRSSGGARWLPDVRRMRSRASGHARAAAGGRRVERNPDHI